MVFGRRVLAACPFWEDPADVEATWKSPDWQKYQRGVSQDRNRPKRFFLSRQDGPLPASSQAQVSRSLGEIWAVWSAVQGAV